MAGSPRNSLGNVRFDMDITYPEHLSRLHRHSILVEYPKSHLNPKKVKNTRNRRGNRYRTQPVTFDEIQEVDEESMIIDNQHSDDQGHAKSTSKLELGLFRFSKALEAKCKKAATTEGSENISGNKDGSLLDKSNGIPPAHAKQDDPLRWTNFSREGSV